MVFDKSGSAKIRKQLGMLSEQKATGKLTLGAASAGSEEGQAEATRRQWDFYFVGGRLLYATGGRHPVRRWSRALSQHCPKFASTPQQAQLPEPWEYQILHQGMVSGVLSAAEIKAMIRTTAQEVCFDIARHPAIASRWYRYSKIDANINKEIPLSILLSSLDVAQIIDKATQLWMNWQGMGLSYIFPDQAPVFKSPRNVQKQISSESFLNLNQLFNGDNTLWDIALKRKQSVLGLTRTLHHFVQQGTLLLTEVPDSPLPWEQMQLVSSAANSYKPLIACIDDSPLVTEKLKQILHNTGYRVLGIQDPMQGVATLAEHKPDLIFLDVVMPQTNGYNLCSFLRQSTLFRDTPIIILTSRDGLIDRTRAKINGATDFLSKPPEEQQVREIVAKYLMMSYSANRSQGALSMA